MGHDFLRLVEELATETLTSWDDDGRHPPDRIISARRVLKCLHPHRVAEGETVVHSGDREVTYSLKEPAEAVVSDEPVHEYMGLTYSNYLVLHRSILQSMPAGWQARFVELMQWAEQLLTKHDIPQDVEYSVTCVGEGEDQEEVRIDNPIPHYDRGRTRLWENE